MRKTMRAWLLVGVITLAVDAGAVYAGPVILDGGDRDDHGSFDGTNNVAGWKFIEQALHFLDTNATNGGTGVLVIGATDKALAAVTSATTVLGLAQTVITGAAISTTSFSGFRILYVPADGNTSGGITDPDNELLIMRKADIQSFVNGGGGLMMLTQIALTHPFGSVELPLPFVVDGSFTGPGADTGMFQTPALAAAGFSITDAELTNGTPVHNRFIGPPGFNGLQVLVTNGPNGTGDIITLGGGSGTTFGPQQQPAPAMSTVGLTVAAVLLGGVGFAVLRRKARLTPIAA